MSKITPQIIREFLDYDPETGLLYWKERDRKWFIADRFHGTWNTRYAGKRAFTSVNTQGYFQGQILDKLQRAHRVVWAHYYGEWPKDQVDHINGVRIDNRIANLRSVTNKQNSRNSTLNIRNTSGVCGVSWCEERKKWQAYITVDGKMRPLGRYEHKSEAIAVRKAAEKEHGFSERHGT